MRQRLAHNTEQAPEPLIPLQSTSSDNFLHAIMQLSLGILLSAAALTFGLPWEIEGHGPVVAHPPPFACEEGYVRSCCGFFTCGPDPTGVGTLPSAVALHLARMMIADSKPLLPQIHTAARRSRPR